MCVNNLSPDFGATGNDLLPTVILDSYNKEVLMVGVSSKESFKLTTQTGRVTLWSRTRQCLWIKGETSGNLLFPRKIIVSCEGKSLVIFAEPTGLTCHMGVKSCFDDPKTGCKRIIDQLSDQLVTRRAEGKIIMVFQDHWTRDILWSGYVGECGAKVISKGHGFWSDDAHSICHERLQANIDDCRRRYINCCQSAVLIQSTSAAYPFCSHASTHSCFYSECGQERVIWQA